MKFSILIPTYNRRDFVLKAVMSVLSQTYDGDFEIIVVDNRSTDGTVEALEEISDARVKIFSIENGGVIARSRNVALEAASGDWIAFLDSDDRWLPHKLEVISRLIRIDAGDFYYHPMEIEQETPNLLLLRNSRVSKTKMMHPFDHLLFQDSPIICSSVVVKRSLLRRVGGMSERKNMTGAEDLNCWLRLSLLTSRFFKIEESLGYLKVHDGAASTKVNGARSHHYAVFQFRHMLSNNQKRRLASVVLSRYARYHLIKHEYRMALEKQLCALSLYSLHRSTFKNLVVLLLIITKMLSRRW